MMETGSPYLEAICTAAELLSLTDKEQDELEKLHGDVVAQARWWRQRRQPALTHEEERV
jgi:hypothetical protein